MLKTQRIRRILVSEEIDVPDAAKMTSYQEKTSFRGLHAAPLSNATHKTSTQISTHRLPQNVHTSTHAHRPLHPYTDFQTCIHKLLRTYTHTLAYGPLASCNHEKAIPVCVIESMSSFAGSQVYVSYSLAGELKAPLGCNQLALWF